MSTSYQDLDTRVRQMERKLDFIMKTITITHQYRSPLMPEQVMTESRSLLELYRAVNLAGLEIMSPEEARTNGLDPSAETLVETPLTSESTNVARNV